MNSSVTNYWWGYARYMCDCVANDFAANLNSAASGSLIGIDSAYW